MENCEEPSVLTLLTDFDTQDHGLDVMRVALNYQVSIEMNRCLDRLKTSFFLPKI